MSVAPRSILLVDDDADCAEELAELLVCEGFAVACAGSVKSARKALEAGRFKVLLVDLELGDGTGIDIVEAARKLPGAPAIVMISGRALRGEEIERLGGDAPALLVKPLSIETLLGLIAEC